MTAAHDDYSDLHEIIDRLAPDQAEVIRRHALRLVNSPPPSRFRVLRTFDGPSTDLGARAKDVLREEMGETGDLEQTSCTEVDLVRMGELMRQYRGFPLGIADASVIALAERLKVNEVATLDHRHFRSIVPAHTPALNLLP
jgi:hypothetical protein